jgi:hypothetical protein
MRPPAMSSPSDRELTIMNNNMWHCGLGIPKPEISSGNTTLALSPAFQVLAVVLMCQR